jgi:hypothetical protein
LHTQHGATNQHSVNNTAPSPRRLRSSVLLSKSQNPLVKCRIPYFATCQPLQNPAAFILTKKDYGSTLKLFVRLVHSARSVYHY